MVKWVICLLPVAVLMSCFVNHVDEPVRDPTPYFDSLSIEASSYQIPLNEYGVAYFKAITEFENDLTADTEFYVDGVLLQGNEFKPVITGSHYVKGIYKDIESPAIQVVVEEPRNKKVLIEYFTSRTCGWCPWIGLRADSLDTANDQIISYSIHGEDELAVPEVNSFQEYQMVNGRPGIRVNRGFVRNFSTPIQITGLVDSIHYFLSKQTNIELAINTGLHGQTLDIEVFGKFYNAQQSDIYLTVVLVEDNIITYEQANYFAGANYMGCPYIDQPNPLPEYVNHNTLRRFMTDSRGDHVTVPSGILGREMLIASSQYTLSNIGNPGETYVIAILHERRADIMISSVLNSQIVRIGEDVGFQD